MKIFSRRAAAVLPIGSGVVLMLLGWHQAASIHKYAGYETQFRIGAGFCLLSGAFYLCMGVRDYLRQRNRPM